MDSRIDTKCMPWCLDNDIKIYPIVWKEANPEKPPRLAIRVDYKGYKMTGDLLWSQKRREEKKAMYKKINELYCYYFNRDKNK